MVTTKIANITKLRTGNGSKPLPSVSISVSLYPISPIIITVLVIRDTPTFENGSCEKVVHKYHNGKFRCAELSHINIFISTTVRALYLYDGIRIVEKFSALLHLCDGIFFCARVYRIAAFGLRTNVFIEYSHLPAEGKRCKTRSHMLEETKI